ncbi:MAG: hypothetical protein QNJ44_12700 [Rhodobacter sp.]|nr:hypothetical protein [Rhodobacter sp.]
MRTRSRSDGKRVAERTFPIRLRIDVPERGFGRTFEQMYDWLDAHAGREGYAWCGDTLPGHSAVAVYLRNPELVIPFVAAFNLTLTRYDE